MNNRDFLKLLGLNIKIIRTIKGISQDEIANALDIDKSYFSKVERGLANPTVTYLRDLAKYFGIKFTDLTDENFEPQKIMFN